MERWEILIPARKKEAVATPQVVKLMPEAYNALVEIYNESSASMKEIASRIITEGAKHVKYQKEDI